MDHIQEIAGALRCTERMAAAFVESIRERVGPDLSGEIILSAIRRTPPSKISTARIASEVRKVLARKPRRRATTPRVEVDRPAASSSPETPNRRRVGASPPGVRHVASRAPHGRAHSERYRPETLEIVLDTNWTRAEEEGFRPDRLGSDEFIRAVRLSCDRRDASRARILKACQRIDKQDVVITPALVADIIREEA